MAIALTFFLILILGIKIKKWFVAIFLISVFTSFISALYWLNPLLGLYPISFLAGALLFQSINKQALHKFIDISSWVIVVQLIGAAIGFLVAYYNIDPFISYKNPDGRDAHFFYTTLTNVYGKNYIRPSGIYDEPGTLSMVVTCVAAIRHIMGKDKKLTWLMLLMGLVTASLAHIIYIFFHLISERFKIKEISFLVALAFIGGILMSYTGGLEKITNKVSYRLQISEDGTIQGDNRTWRMKNAMEVIAENPTSVVLFGVDPACTLDYSKCEEKYEPMGENPISPLAFRGILMTWQYYVVVLMFSVSILLGRKYFAILGLALIFAQRPYVMSSGFSLFAIIVFFLVLEKFKSQIGYWQWRKNDFSHNSVI